MAGPVALPDRRLGTHPPAQALPPYGGANGPVTLPSRAYSVEQGHPSTLIPARHDNNGPISTAHRGPTITLPLPMPVEDDGEPIPGGGSVYQAFWFPNTGGAKAAIAQPDARPDHTTNTYAVPPQGNTPIIWFRQFLLRTLRLPYDQRLWATYYKPESIQRGMVQKRQSLPAARQLPPYTPRPTRYSRYRPYSRFIPPLGTKNG